MNIESHVSPHLVGQVLQDCQLVEALLGLPASDKKDQVGLEVNTGLNLEGLR